MSSIFFFSQVVSAIASCLPGVFLSRRRIAVVREQLSVVTPELACMEDLWTRRWRYFINLTGMEMPLRTNWELVQILKAYNGANDILGSVSWWVEGLGAMLIRRSHRQFS